MYTLDILVSACNAMLGRFRTILGDLKGVSQGMEDNFESAASLFILTLLSFLLWCPQICMCVSTECLMHSALESV